MFVANYYRDPLFPRYAELDGAAYQSDVKRTNTYATLCTKNQSARRVSVNVGLINFRSDWGLKLARLRRIQFADCFRRGKTKAENGTLRRSVCRLSRADVEIIFARARAARRVESRSEHTAITSISIPRAPRRCIRARARSHMCTACVRARVCYYFN